MKKVLILQEILPHYRVPLFNRIGKEPGIELTVGFNKTFKFNNAEAVNFNAISISKQKLGKFYKIRNFRNLIRPFDYIIITADLHWLPILILALIFKKRSKIYFWGIGISSEKGLKKKSLADKLRFILNDISSGTILYSTNIAEYYKENVRKKEQVYVAKNTIEVEKFPFPKDRRTKIISIGSFKKYKNLSNLILAFSEILNQLESDITLDFIGDGEEEKELKNLVNKYHLNNRVLFWGRKESDKEIYPIISKAMVCVSPTQAGLAVLHAMAFGCPFLTAEDAITGGERFYIQNNINGYFYDGSVAELCRRLLWIVKNPEKNLAIANNAYNFYHENCNIENYANSFINVVSPKISEK